jgi:hypothetical protein
MKKRTLIIIFAAVFIIGILFARFSGLVVTSINTCTDSDSGKNYAVKGNVQGVYYLLIKEEYSEEDYCKDEKTLVEHYCVSEDMHSYRENEEYTCETGCEDGKCIDSRLKELPAPSNPPEEDYLTLPVKEEEVKSILQRIKEWLGT